MRVVERDVRLLVLAVSAGSADGWSYLGLGHAFVANMTGNTVLLGIAVFQNHGDLLHPAIALCCYAVGAMLGSAFTAGVQPGMLWSKAISWTLTLEALLLLAAESWMGHALYEPEPAARYGRAGRRPAKRCAGRAENSGSRDYLHHRHLDNLADRDRAVCTQPAKAGPASGRTNELQAGVLAAYFLSAVLTGWLFRHFALAAGALPALSLLIVAVHGIVRG